MKVKSLDGIEYNLKTSSNNSDRSSYHALAIEIINKNFPAASIAEEVQIMTRRGKYLYIDIFLPAFRLAIEIHGEQHYVFNKFFFKDKKSFALADRNLKDKKQWCELNSIECLELKYNEQSTWESRIRSCINTATERI